jgi:putative RecB family exonuclease
MIAPAKPHPNAIAQQLTRRPYLSWSAVSCYASCPLRYAFRYVEGLPEPSVSASLVFGGAIHKACEAYYREVLAGGPLPSLDALLAAYHDGWLEHEAQVVQFGKTEDRAALDDLAGRMLAAFQASELAQPAGTILGIEEELTGQVIPGVPDLLARIDLLVDEGDGLLVVDLKTARSRWSQEQVQDSAGQLHLYHELARPLADGRPVRLEFAVLTKTKSPEVFRHEVTVAPQQIGRTKRIVERVWRAIEAGNFYPAPSAMNCPGCPYRAQCRAWTG